MIACRIKLCKIEFDGFNAFVHSFNTCGMICTVHCEYLVTQTDCSEYPKPFYAVLSFLNNLAITNTC